MEENKDIGVDELLEWAKLNHMVMSESKAKEIVDVEKSVKSIDAFEEYIDFCNYLRSNLNDSTYIKLKNSTLYKYNSKYYFCMPLDNLDLNTFKSIHCFIIEFATHISNSDIFERKLTEYGIIIFKSNAIGNCIKAFL